jgi:hypothetical protein
MESTRDTDREELDRATSLLMASLQESRALNGEFREALLVGATSRTEATDQSRVPCLELLDEIFAACGPLR